jgi:hypothetical protein
LVAALDPAPVFALIAEDRAAARGAVLELLVNVDGRTLHGRHELLDQILLIGARILAEKGGVLLAN